MGGYCVYEGEWGVSMVEEDYLYVQETYKIIGACMTVHRELGAGFLEAVYQEALAVEFLEMGIPFQREKQLEVLYKGTPLAKKYVADFVCFDRIILELKAVDDLSGPHIAQVINYLKATQFRVGLLVNFGSKSLQQKRLIL